MPIVLVVDDSPVDRRLIGRLLEKGKDYTVDYAGHGVEALRQLETRMADIVLTDMQMPNMDGLKLVETIHRMYPLLPVIIMTAHGSEDIAVKALMAGAAGFVPKGGLARALVDAVESVLSATRPKGQQERLLECVNSGECALELENDRALFAPLLEWVQQLLAGLRLVDRSEALRVALAVEEALLNALYHGNLELSQEEMFEATSRFHEGGGDRPEPGQQAVPTARRIHVDIRFSREQASFTIRDDGAGFDSATLPNPLDPATLTSETGRGLVLMRTFMDEVRFNAEGNEVTLVKVKAK
ncbi:MAG TPA: response regulator [Pirellulales bacterium]